MTVISTLGNGREVEVWMSAVTMTRVAVGRMPPGTVLVPVATQTLLSNPDSKVVQNSTAPKAAEEMFRPGLAAISTLCCEAVLALVVL